MHRNSPKPGNDLEPMWSNNYTQAIRAVALENGPHLGPGVAPPTNNTNCIEFTMNTRYHCLYDELASVLPMNSHQSNTIHIGILRTPLTLR